jgi:hypothetical protein
MGRTLAGRGEIVEGHDHAGGAQGSRVVHPFGSGTVRPAVISLAIIGVADRRTAATTASIQATPC